MKNLFKSFFALMMIVSVSTFSFTACGSDDKDEPVKGDKTALTALVTECETLANAAKTEDYPAEVITAFKTVIAAAKTLGESATQTQVDNMAKQLEVAKKTFLAGAYGAIPEAALVLGLDFDAADATELTTTGKIVAKAKLVGGPAEIFATTALKPTYVDGVKGGKAMHFAKGGHLEIENYSPADLMSNKISIATWVKLDSTRAANYIASLNYWENWKLQIEDHGKPFFTYCVETKTEYLNADNQSDNSFPNGAWTHLVVSLDQTAKTLTFYVNGQESKKWDVATKPELAKPMVAAYQSPLNKQLPFVIGAATTYEQAKAGWAWQGWDNPKEWSYLAGALDNFAIYNIALDAGQVAKLYKDQKAQ